MDHDNLEDSQKLKALSNEDEDKYTEDQEFEESPRPKGPSNGVDRDHEGSDEKLDANDEERIEIAEKVLIRIVKTMSENGVSNIR